MVDIIDNFDSKYADELEALDDQYCSDYKNIDDSPNKLYIALSDSPEKSNVDVDILCKKRLRVSSPEINVKKSKIEICDKEDVIEKVVNDSIIKNSLNYRKIPNGDFVSMTNHNGQKYYFQLKDSKLNDERFKIQFKTKCVNLLGMPLSILKYQIQQKLSKPNIKMSSAKSESLVKNKNLWVDKYSPQSYHDLISEELTNRNLLRWLKQWDFCVHQRALPYKYKNSKTNILNNETKILPLESFDQYNRPLFKVTLVSGPPGLGKTTLAYIVAKHAGYNIVEINASDDRSVEVFKEKIESATQMKSVTTANPKPNCLIIDEIDGSPAAAINYLVTLIKGKENVPAKKKPENLLMRPIICICNDLYVPALRPLKQIAYLIYFNTFSSNKLASRLLEISRKELIKTDLTCMMALCEKTENDIRSCINTLQFVKSDKKDLNLRSIESMNLGQKDSHKTLFQVWDNIFSLPKPIRKRRANPYESINASPVDSAVIESQEDSGRNKLSPFNRFMDILAMVSAIGEDPKIMQGLFENYLETKAKDTRLEMMQQASQWFCWNDLLLQNINHHQNYSLLRYLSFLSVAMHLMYATNQPPKITYPHADYDLQTGKARSENILTSMMSDVCPSIRSLSNRSFIVMQTVPYLVFIIHPNIRPVNMQLFSTKEKEEIVNVVGIMRSYNLSYLQEKNKEGQFVFNLDPNIELISKFLTETKLSKLCLSHANKQMIAREIELERLRKHNKYEENLQNVDGKEIKKPFQVQLKQNLAPKAIVIKDTSKQIKDFFGRNLHPTQIEKLENASKELKKTNDIYYHFKEGFTNAVRRTVRIKDFK